MLEKSPDHVRLADLCGDLMSASQRLRPQQRDEFAAEAPAGWQSTASCAGTDPEAFFPAKGAVPPRAALRMCAGCPARRKCLAMALRFNLDGIWAGTNPGDRDELYGLLESGLSARTVLDLAIGSTCSEAA
ncbi:MAG TPA: WhiB family transcriptional regulator [Marmoricola sp.]|nr:WhiB family transcriptional regulator [Marmoricola sp.]